MRTKSFREEFEYFWDRIFVKRQYTYLARYADGEAGLLQGKSFNHMNQIDGWVSSGFNKFNDDLRRAISHKESDYFYGISCKCCDEVTKQYLLSQLKCDDDQTTYSNLWVNGNYNEFKRRLALIDEDVIVVGNSIGCKSQYPFRVSKYESISGQIIQDWKTKRTQIIRSFIELIVTKKNPLVLFAAGPLSEILIDCAKCVTTGRFVDIGSALDEYIFGRQTRPYMILGTPFNTRMCEF